MCAANARVDECADTCVDHCVDMCADLLRRMRSDMHVEAKTATAALPPSVAYLFHTVVAGNSDSRVAGGLLVAWIVFFAVGLCQVLQSWVICRACLELVHHLNIMLISGCGVCAQL